MGPLIIVKTKIFSFAILKGGKGGDSA